jgi:hypothetical protein
MSSTTRRWCCRNVDSPLKFPAINYLLRIINASDQLPIEGLADGYPSISSCNPGNKRWKFFKDFRCQRS